MDIAQKKVITSEFRASFPQVFEPKSFQGQAPKYSLVMLFDKKTTNMKPLHDAAKNAAREKWGDDEKKWPKNLAWPFRDGSEREDTAGYKGCTFITATSKEPPGVVDEDMNAFMDRKGFYSGCYARAEVIAFAYEAKDNQSGAILKKGVSFSLQNVQKLRDGKPFSGKKAPNEVFSKVEKQSDNPENYPGGEESEEESYDLG